MIPRIRKRVVVEILVPSGGFCWDRHRENIGFNIAIFEGSSSISESVPTVVVLYLLLVLPVLLVEVQLLAMTSGESCTTMVDLTIFLNLGRCDMQNNLG